MIEFEVPGKPQGKGRPRVTVRGKFAHAYTPEDTISYENLIKFSYKAVADTMNIIHYNNPLCLMITAIYSVPSSYSKKKANAALAGELVPMTKPDVDNIAKVVCDALNTIAYKDDNQIVELSIHKRYGVEPRLKIKIIDLKNDLPF